MGELRHEAVRGTAVPGTTTLGQGGRGALDEQPAGCWVRAGGVGRGYRVGNGHCLKSKLILIYF